MAGAVTGFGLAGEPRNVGRRLASGPWGIGMGGVDAAAGVAGATAEATANSARISKDASFMNARVHTRPDGARTIQRHARPAPVPVPRIARAPRGVSGAIFTRTGEDYVPTELARGPWDPDAQHGGAPAALLGREIERCPAAGEMLVARVTVEFLRPVPLAALRARTRMLRPGRRVQLVEASLDAGGVEVCRATALRIRRDPGVVEAVAGEEDRLPAPELGRVAVGPVARGQTTFVTEGCEVRFVSGDYGAGPAQAWIRLRVPLLAGEEPSPLQRTLAAADFGNGVSAALDWTSHLFVNSDLTVYLERPAVGEWIGLDSRTRIDAAGTGTAESVLHDERGRIGRSLQSLYVDRR